MQMSTIKALNATEPSGKKTERFVSFYEDITTDYM